MKKVILFILSLPLFLCGCEETVVTDPNYIVGYWESDEEIMDPLLYRERWHITFTPEMILSNYWPDQTYSSSPLVREFCSLYRLTDDGRLALWHSGKGCFCDSILWYGEVSKLDSAYNNPSNVNDSEFSITRKGENTLILYQKSHSHYYDSQEFKFYRVKY